MTEGQGTRIELRLDGDVRGWHAALAKALGRAGARVTLHADAHRPSAPAGATVLLLLEGLVYGARPPGLATVPEPNLPPADGGADLTMDLRQSGGSGVSILRPLYDGAPGFYAALPALLDGRAPLIQIERGGLIVAEGLPAIEQPHVVARSLAAVMARTATLLRQAVRETGRRSSLARPVAAPASTAGAIARFAAAGLAAKIAARLARLVARDEHWSVGVRWTDTPVRDTLAWPDPGAYTWIPDDGARFFADPFVLHHEGVAHVFCEEFPYATGRGLISAFSVAADGTMGPPRPVLETGGHLSYPHVFARDGAIWMIPETSDTGRIELWRATRFPDAWERAAVLVDDVVAADATLLEHDGRLWLFASTSDDGGSSWDSLSLFSAPALLGPWTAHPGNPVLVDVRAARPAGVSFVRPDGLWRPAQDCSGGYGSALALCRVERLDEAGFAQDPPSILRPPAAWSARGCHTLNEAGGLEVVDRVGRRA